MDLDPTKSSLLGALMETLQSHESETLRQLLEHVPVDKALKAAPYERSEERAGYANGLLKEEIYPDGTKHTFIYDLLGRVIQETKSGITWTTEYDDLHHRVVRTHVDTGDQEISEFDQRGNLIRFTDAAGYVSTKVYDQLNRVIQASLPSGETTSYFYKGDCFYISLPSGETKGLRYEAGKVAESCLYDSRGDVLSTYHYSYNPFIDEEEIIQGDEKITTLKNSLALPIKVQTAGVITLYEYDACGNCISLTDGEGRRVQQEFNGLGQVIRRHLADGSTLTFCYDQDGNLTDYGLPGGAIWRASYDMMGRKIAEELKSKNCISGDWKYSYENGYLTKCLDPMKRIHIYQHDSYGRVVSEKVDSWRRMYTYDPRGLLLRAEQVGRGETSLVERSYDANGRISQDLIYLNNKLIQKSEQQWTGFSRILHIGEHEREFRYQNNQLVGLKSKDLALSYRYSLSGLLVSQSSPLTSATISYVEGLPQEVISHAMGITCRENLKWDRSGKLFAYTTPYQNKEFTYDLRGQLKSAGKERYEFDHRNKKTGVLTEGVDWLAPGGDVDSLGRILSEIKGKECLLNTYNQMGELISHGLQRMEWDPWGRLIHVIDNRSTWKASYDALGRRLQIKYQPCWYKSSSVTTSYYDPEGEFREIGVNIDSKCYWKFYGPNSCDAVTDELGNYAILQHNMLGQLTHVISKEKSYKVNQLPSAYGYIKAPSVPTDLLSYAQTLSWHSKSQDPTGFIWMGARYYDPQSGRFISTDPVPYPSCLNLYTYANGDPINYVDPKGRFATEAYKPEKEKIFYSFMEEELDYKTGCGLSHSFNLGSAAALNFKSQLRSLFVNGVNNTFLDAYRSACYLQELSGECEIRGIYSKSHGMVRDLFECLDGFGYLATRAVLQIHRELDLYFEENPAKGNILLNPHSQGAIHVRNALMSYPEQRFPLSDFP